MRNKFIFVLLTAGLFIAGQQAHAITPMVQFSVTSSSGLENVSNPVITVSLSSSSYDEVSVEYSVASDNPGTATLGVDYGPPTFGILTIPAGSLSESLTLSIIEDAVAEGSETIRIVLSGPTNASLGANTIHTYTIQDNDTTSGGGQGNTGGTGSEPGSGSSGNTGVSSPGPCPVLRAGDMVKVVGKPAIYAVNKDNKIMYFPDGDVFKSWNQTDSYAGLYTSISQECFDSLPTPTTFPGGINFRPGSYVIQKESSSQLYVVKPGNAIAQISLVDARALYGMTLTPRVIKSLFWSNYTTIDPNVTGRAHTGMIIRKDGKNWYVEGQILREITPAGMIANRFKDSFVRTVPGSYLTGFTVGDPIDGFISSVADGSQGA